MSQQLCQNGEKCQFLKLGTCKFAHKASPKAQSRIDHKAVNTKDKQKSAKKVVKQNIKLTAIHGGLKHPAYIAFKRNRQARADLFAKYKLDMSTYFDVKQNADVKLPAANSLFDRELKLLDDECEVLRAAARQALGGQHVKVKLFTANTISSGTGAAIAGYYGIMPANSGEWASLIALYDECRVTAIRIDHICGVTTSSGTNNAGKVVPYAICWDPDYNTVPSGVNDVQESSQSALYAANCGNVDQTIAPVKMHVFEAKVPFTGAVLNSDMKTAPNFPGSWMNCLDTADTVGYIRYYATALGANGILGWYQNQEMHVEFRIRT